jgi:hypothetical protein
MADRSVAVADRPVVGRGVDRGVERPPVRRPDRKLFRFESAPKAITPNVPAIHSVNAILTDLTVLTDRYCTIHPLENSMARSTICLSSEWRAN